MGGFARPSTRNASNAVGALPLEAETLVRLGKANSMRLEQDLIAYGIERIERSGET